MAVDLKTWRESRGITRSQVAKTLGVTWQLVAHIEEGNLPGTAYLTPYAKAYELHSKRDFRRACLAGRKPGSIEARFGSVHRQLH